MSLSNDISSQLYLTNNISLLMKKTISPLIPTKFLASVILIIVNCQISTQVFAQQQEEQRCHSFEYLELMKKNNPEYAQMFEQSEIYLQNYIATHPNLGKERTVITIPVVVHLLFNPLVPRTVLSDWQITSQIDVLNEDYRRFNADKIKTPAVFQSVAADVEIEFALANRDPNGNWTNGIRRVQTSNLVFADFTSPKYTSMGGDNAWSRDNYLNLWVCELDSPLLGYSTFPSASMDETDGVVIHCKAFGRIDCNSKKYYLGRTGTHEIGHWLNLIHVWGDEDCCNADDGCDDTPLQAKPTYKCQEFPFTSLSSCNNQPCNTVGDMFMNYMDYTVDSCMNIFSNDQRTQMLAAFNSFRSSILSSQALISPTSFSNDIGITKVLFPDELIYGDSMAPVVRIHNYGTQSISSCDIYYEKDWKNYLNTFHWTGNLASDGEVDVTLPKIADSLWYNIFCAWTKDPNGTQDEDTTNDFRTRSYVVRPATEPTENNVIVYPNPSNTQITVEFKDFESLQGSYFVYNILGQRVHLKMDQISLTKYQFDFTNLPSGMYLLRFNVNGSSVTKKVIVQHEL
ncbi:MAG TPA: hypothetical protein DCQ93_10880 [Bacteroidetes bacterium]|nr:hypothetical protein [Bacteroidota bacterium]